MLKDVDTYVYLHCSSVIESSSLLKSPSSNIWTGLTLFPQSEYFSINCNELSMSFCNFPQIFTAK